MTITDYHGTKIQLEFILFETNLHICLYFAWLAILTVSKIACYKERYSKRICICAKKFKISSGTSKNACRIIMIFYKTYVGTRHTQKKYIVWIMSFYLFIAMSFYLFISILCEKNVWIGPKSVVLISERTHFLIVSIGPQSVRLTLILI